MTQIQEDVMRKSDKKDERKKLEDLLKIEDLELFAKKLDEEQMKETPLLVAAEIGSYKILKSIIELATTNFEEFKKKINFDHCNERGHNVLHLGKLNLNNFYDPSYKSV